MSSIAFLLGAGASVDAGLATSNSLVDEFVDYIGVEDRQLSALLSRLIDFAIPWKKNYLFFKHQQLAGIDDEWLFSQIGIRGSDVAPFNTGFTNQQAADSFERWLTSKGSASRYLNIEDVARILFDLDEDEFIGNPLSILVEDNAKTFLRNHKGEIFDLQTKLLSFIKERLLRLSDPSYLACLSSFISSRGVQGPLELPPVLPVFTFNYDLAVETACSKAGVSVTDGLTEGSALSRLDFATPGAQILLYKLHGSLNWFTFQADALLIGKKGIKQLPYHQYRQKFMQGPPTGVYTGSDWIIKDSSKSSEFYSDGMIQAMVFGTDQKMQTSVPYFDLLRKFAEILSQVRVLVTLGYGFGDTHINRMIVSFFNQFTESYPFRLVVVGPDFVPGQEYRMARKLGLDLTGQNESRFRAIPMKAKQAFQSGAILEAVQEALP